MSNFLLRNIDPGVWAKVKDRAAKEGRTLRGVLILLIAYYAKHGLPE